jgi:protein gp37
MQRTKIEWADYVWNPIKGLCPVGCWYCYARRIYQRFKWDVGLWLDIAELNQAVETRLTGKRIFVCSTFEIFHPVVDKLTGRCADGQFLPVRDLIFDVIERRPDLTFVILTKMPERIDRPMPDNVWLGISVTQQEEAVRKSGLMKHEAKIRFISYEPMLGELDPAILCGPDWAILGRLTGHGKKHDPELELIEAFVDDARRLTIPVFLKDNLREIWGEPLIQEFPE